MRSNKIIKYAISTVSPITNSQWKSIILCNYMKRVSSAESTDFIHQIEPISHATTRTFIVQWPLIIIGRCGMSKRIVKHSLSAIAMLKWCFSPDTLCIQDYYSVAIRAKCVFWHEISYISLSFSLSLSLSPCSIADQSFFNRDEV
jgi:hypothetical protein